MMISLADTMIKRINDIKGKLGGCDLLIAYDGKLGGFDVITVRTEYKGIPGGSNFRQWHLSNATGLWDK